MLNRNEMNIVLGLRSQERLKKKGTHILHGRTELIMGKETIPQNKALLVKETLFVNDRLRTRFPMD